MKRCAALVVCVLALALATSARADTNVALNLNGGVALFGYNTGSTTTLGTLYNHAGDSTYLNDGLVNGNNGDDMWPNGNGKPGFVGALFTLSPNTQVNSVVFYGRNFGDGGWFGTQNQYPQGANNTLTAANLIAPSLQFTTDGGVTWTTDANVTNDYVTQFTGSSTNGGSPTNPATFTLTVPLTGVDGIRLIGPQGGVAAGGGFLGADEIEVFAGAVPEPSTWAMLFCGLALMLGAIRFRAVRG